MVQFPTIFINSILDPLCTWITIVMMMRSDGTDCEGNSTSSSTSWYRVNGDQGTVEVLCLLIRMSDVLCSSNCDHMIWWFIKCGKLVMKIDYVWFSFLAFYILMPHVLHHTPSFEHILITIFLVELLNIVQQK